MCLYVFFELDLTYTDANVNVMLNICDFNFFAMESETGDVFAGVGPLAIYS